LQIESSTFNLQNNFENIGWGNGETTNAKIWNAHAFGNYSEIGSKKNATRLGGIFFILKDRHLVVCLSLLKF